MSDLWEKLGLPNPDEEENEEYEELQEEAEEEAAADDKISRKLSARQDDLERKFEQQALEQRKRDFLDGADETEAELFKAVSGEVKDIATLDKTMAMVLKKSAELKEKEAALEEAAREKVARAYGVKPGKASSAVPEEDEWEKMRGQARAGDSRAAFRLFMAAPKTLSKERAEQD